MIQRTLLALSVALCLVSGTLRGQAPPAEREALLARLPAGFRVEGDSLLAEPDAAMRATRVADLVDGDDESTTEFLVALLEVEPSPTVRIAILNEIGGDAHPLARPAVERRATMDPAASVAIYALEELRAEHQRTLQDVLEKRLAEAQHGGSREQLDLLARAEERYISLENGTMLPSFMQAPPPVFPVKSAGRPIRVLGFGDFGDGSDEQREVASAMRRFHQRTPFDFAVTLGDNFYSNGMRSPSDLHWQSWWDHLYNPLGIQFWATLGNHDWGYPESPAAEILYASRSPSWRMPATYYSFTA